MDRKNFIAFCYNAAKIISGTVFQVMNKLCNFLEYVRSTVILPQYFGVFLRKSSVNCHTFAVEFILTNY